MFLYDEENTRCFYGMGIQFSRSILPHNLPWPMTGLCQKCLDSMTYENMVPRWKNWKKGSIRSKFKIQNFKTIVAFYHTSFLPPLASSQFQKKWKERFINTKPKHFGKGFSCGEVLKPTENRRLTMCGCLRMLYLIGYGRPLAFQQFRC